MSTSGKQNDNTIDIEDDSTIESENNRSTQVLHHTSTHTHAPIKHVGEVVGVDTIEGQTQCRHSIALHIIPHITAHAVLWTT